MLSGEHGADKPAVRLLTLCLSVCCQQLCVCMPALQSCAQARAMCHQACSPEGSHAGLSQNKGTDRSSAGGSQAGLSPNKGADQSKLWACGQVYAAATAAGATNQGLAASCTPQLAAPAPSNGCAFSVEAACSQARASADAASSQSGAYQLWQVRLLRPLCCVHF